MSPQKNTAYFIKFISNDLASQEFEYEGWGTYTGESMTDKEGNELYWFEDLEEKPGFTKGGWFSFTDIILIPDMLD